MDEIMLLETIERYLSGEMTQQEQILFENLRKSNPEIDQTVVEHTYFLHGLEKFGAAKSFKNTLHEVEAKLVDEGIIAQPKLKGKAKVVYLWGRYKRNMAVAASIAGFISLITLGLMVPLTKKYSNENIQTLVKELNKTKSDVERLKSRSTTSSSNIPVKIEPKVDYRGTGFLLDGKGYLVTNAHVIKNAKTIIVQSKGQEFKASLIKVDTERDLAILKIDDNEFKPFASLPYGFKKSGADLGEQIFTLGFPRDEIVYGEGYMSASTGYNGDTMSCQIAVAANPGNSGGPVFNKNGEVVGILSTRQLQAQGFVFAVTAKNIFESLNELKKDTAYQNIRINTLSSVKGMERPQQIKKIEDCVFLVKTYQ